MTSPVLTVLVLAVLWLIVVVPMVVRRNDDRARDRSVAGFGKAMRALTRRHVALSRPARPADSGVVTTRVQGSRAETFAPSTRRVDLAPAVRRPVPAAEEALMHNVDRIEMSAARARMMARRRRSMTILAVGSVVSLGLAVLMGGVFWVPTLLFSTGLGGYVYFLRSQAIRDRERREARQLRAAGHRSHDYDVTAVYEQMGALPESAVRIDDDDLDLHNHDTVDLTGLYQEEGVSEPRAQRRAS